MKLHIPLHFYITMERLLGQFCLKIIFILMFFNLVDFCSSKCVRTDSSIYFSF